MPTRRRGSAANHGRAEVDHRMRVFRTGSFSSHSAPSRSRSWSVRPTSRQNRAAQTETPQVPTAHPPPARNSRAGLLCRHDRPKAEALRIRRHGLSADQASISPNESWHLGDAPRGSSVSQASCTAAARSHIGRPEKTVQSATRQTTAPLERCPTDLGHARAS